MLKKSDFLTGLCVASGRTKHKITCGLLIILSCFVSYKETYASSNKQYYVQLVSYLSPQVAQNTLQKFLSKHQPGRVRQSIANGKHYYQVQLGPYSQLQQANLVKKRLGAGYIRSYQELSSNPQKIKETRVVRTRPQPNKETVLIESKEPLEAGKPWSWVVAVSGGPAWNSAGRTQSFFVQPRVAEAYIADKPNQVLAAGELFLGAQHKLTDRVSGQLGLAVAGSDEAKLRGDIWNDADPDFNNFSYRYSLSHWHVGVKGKLMFEHYSLVQPYVSGSVGAGFNRARNFKITQKIYEQIAMPPFSSHKETAFTYTIGAGLQKRLNSHWQVGMGYEFADWGASHLGRAAGQTIGSGLQLSHLYASQIQFSLGFVA